MTLFSSAQTRLAELQSGLIVDQVLSVPQVARHFYLEEHDLLDAGLRVVDGFVAATHCARSKMHHRFVMLPDVAFERNDLELRHLAGVAEMRLRLGVPVERWSTWEGHASEVRPDALWHSERGLVAVEYDSGSYSRSTLQDKSRGFSRAYAGQVWGTWSRQRQSTIASSVTASSLVLHGVGIA